jgi:hypothetical protein
MDPGEQARGDPCTAVMPRLIHLNRPPGIGKSALAEIYVDDHAGVLNLDMTKCASCPW